MPAQKWQVSIRRQRQVRGHYQFSSPRPWEAAAVKHKPISTNLDAFPGDQSYNIWSGALKRAGFLQKPGIYQTAKIMVGFTDFRSIYIHLKPGQKSWKVLILWTQAHLQSCPCSSSYGTSNGEGTGSPSGHWDELHAGDLRTKKMRNVETAK